MFIQRGNSPWLPLFSFLVLNLIQKSNEKMLITFDGDGDYFILLCRAAF